MPLTSRDLSLEDRLRLLQELRAKLGSTEYKRLLDMYGHDGLIDLVLAQMEQQQQSGALSPKTVDPPKASVEPGCLFLFGLFLVVCACIYHFIRPETPGTPEVAWWENFDWSWYWKIPIGIAGCILDFMVLLHLAASSSRRTTRVSGSSSVLQNLSGCLELLIYWQAWLTLVGVFLLGTGGGPVLLIWGVVDLFR
jgi:hypothetical protein